jgi:trk system potassium uptake protein TrkA
MKKSFAILGLGRFGLNLVEELSHHNVDIIAVDTSEENVNKASEFISNAAICDITNETALKELGINNVDHAVIAIGSNLQSTIIATIILKEFGIPKITVRVDDDYYFPVMKKLGATDIVSPQKLAGIRLANKIVSDTFIDYYNLSSEFCIVEISVADDIRPLNIQELNPRNRFDVNLLLIQRGKSVFSPKAPDSIEPEDQIFVFGTKQKISAFDTYINSQKKTKE